ncbi:hypothetical protein GCM10009735_77360 [Actinomadura chokoriensis]
MLDGVDGQLVQDEEDVVQSREVGQQMRRECPDESDFFRLSAKLATPVHRGLVRRWDANGEQH